MATDAVVEFPGFAASTRAGEIGHPAIFDEYSGRNLAPLITTNNLAPLITLNNPTTGGSTLRNLGPVSVIGSDRAGRNSSISLAPSRPVVVAREPSRRASSPTAAIAEAHAAVSAYERFERVQPVPEHNLTSLLQKGTQLLSLARASSAELRVMETASLGLAPSTSRPPSPGSSRSAHESSHGIEDPQFYRYQEVRSLRWEAGNVRFNESVSLIRGSSTRDTWPSHQQVTATDRPKISASDRTSSLSSNRSLEMGGGIGTGMEESIGIIGMKRGGEVSGAGARAAGDKALGAQRRIGFQGSLSRPMGSRGVSRTSEEEADDEDDEDDEEQEKSWRLETLAGSSSRAQTPHRQQQMQYRAAMGGDYSESESVRSERHGYSGGPGEDDGRKTTISRLPKSPLSRTMAASKKGGGYFGGNRRGSDSVEASAAEEEESSEEDDDDVKKWRLQTLMSSSRGPPYPQAVQRRGAKLEDSSEGEGGGRRRLQYAGEFQDEFQRGTIDFRTPRSPLSRATTARSSEVALYGGIRREGSEVMAMSAAEEEERQQGEEGEEEKKWRRDPSLPSSSSRPPSFRRAVKQRHSHLDESSEGEDVRRRHGHNVVLREDEQRVKMLRPPKSPLSKTLPIVSTSEVGGFYGGIRRGGSGSIGPSTAENSSDSESAMAVEGRRRRRMGKLSSGFGGFRSASASFTSLKDLDKDPDSFAPMNLSMASMAPPGNNEFQEGAAVGGGGGGGGGGKGGVIVEKGGADSDEQEVLVASRHRHEVTSCPEFRRVSSTMGREPNLWGRVVRKVGNWIQRLASAIGFGEDEEGWVDDLIRNRCHDYYVPKEVYGGGRVSPVNEISHPKSSECDDDMEDEEIEQKFSHSIPPELFEVQFQCQSRNISSFRSQESTDYPPVVLFKGGEYVRVRGLYPANDEIDEEEGEVVLKAKEDGVGDFAVIVSFFIAMMGGGILVMPWVIAESGLSAGVILTVLTGGLSAYTCTELLKRGKVYTTVLLSRFGKEYDHIGDLAGAVLGNQAVRLVHLLLCGLLLGIAVAYGLIMVGSIESVIEGVRKLLAMMNHDPAGVKPVPLEPITDPSSGSNTFALSLSLLFQKLTGREDDASLYGGSWGEIWTSLKAFAVDIVNDSVGRIVSTLGPSLFASSLELTKMIAIGVAAFMVVPLACLREMRWLATGNVLAVMCMIYLYMFILSQGVLEGIKGMPVGHARLGGIWGMGYNTFRIAAVLIPIFFTHHAVLPLNKVAKKQHHTKRNVIIAYVLATLGFLSAGLMGAYSVKEESGKGHTRTQSDGTTVPMNYLDSFNNALVIPMTVRAATILLAEVALPSLLCMIRIQLFGVVFKKEYPSVLLVLLLNLAVFGLIAVAVYLELGIADVMGLAGSCFGVLLVFILPAIIDMRFHTLRDGEESQLMSFAVNYLVITFGALAFIGQAIWLFRRQF